MKKVTGRVEEQGQGEWLKAARLRLTLLAKNKLLLLAIIIGPFST